MSSSRSAASVVVIALLVAGCAGSAEGSGVDDGASPLADLLGWNEAPSPAEERALQLQVEQAVATCMRAEGFDYIAVDAAGELGGPSEEDAALAADPEAYGKKYGYGIVFNYEQYEEPMLTGAGTDASTSGFVDPNEEYVSSLGETERDTYYELLYGNAVFADADDQAAPPTAEEMGCYGSAQVEVFGDRIVVDPEINNRISDFFQSMDDDPDVRAAERDWLDCLTRSSADLDAVEGYQIVSPDSMYGYMTLRKAQAQGKTVVPLDPATGEPVGGASGDEGWGSIELEDGSGWAYFGADELIPEDALEHLREVELALWQEDWSCQQSSGLLESRRRVEQRLVDELRSDYPDLGRN